MGKSRHSRVTVKTLTEAEQAPFDLKGSLFTLTVLHLRRPDLALIDAQLAEKIQQAPGFFQNAPVVIDLDDLLDPEAPVDFSGLHDVLRKHQMIPVGIRHGSPELRAAALLAGLPALPEIRPPPPKKPEEPEKVLVNTRIYAHPVRSGQQIYATGGDLVVLGAISPGAEVLADGSIHIYGPLRGRALAGVKGDQRARIFCQSLEAELVSIAGNYRLIEQLDASRQGQFVQVYLSEERLIIEPLSRGGSGGL